MPRSFNQSFAYRRRGEISLLQSQKQDFPLYYIYYCTGHLGQKRVEYAQETYTYCLTFWKKGTFLMFTCYKDGLKCEFDTFPSCISVCK